MKRQRDLQVCIFGSDGDIIVQVNDDEVMLTIRNPRKEEKVSLRLGPQQARLLSEILEYAPGLFDDDEDE